MKFRAVILALLIAGSFAGCKKESKSNAALIHGDWYLKEIIYSNVKQGVETVTMDIRLEPSDLNAHFIFYNDGTGLQHPPDPMYANIATFNYKLADAVLTVDPKFFITGRNTFTVKSLSNSEMILTAKTIAPDGSYDSNEYTFSK